jgi:hypothetical protein
MVACSSHDDKQSMDGGTAGGPTVACATLATCCQSDLPANLGSACGTLAKSSDESACSQALIEIQAASYCNSGSADLGPSKSADQCDQYLSCLLATEPDAYAAALQLYGSGSPCWANSTQTAGCNQACESAFASIASSCTCTGDSCTACNAPAAGTYELSNESVACAGFTEITDFTVDGSVSSSALSGIYIQVDSNSGGSVVEFAGTLACNGASAFSDGMGDSLTLAPTSTQGSFLVTITEPSCSMTMTVTQ